MVVIIDDNEDDDFMNDGNISLSLSLLFHTIMHPVPVVTIKTADSIDTDDVVLSKLLLLFANPFRNWIAAAWCALPIILPLIPFLNIPWNIIYNFACGAYWSLSWKNCFNGIVTVFVTIYIQYNSCSADCSICNMSNNEWVTWWVVVAIAISISQNPKLTPLTHRQIRN